MNTCTLTTKTLARWACALLVSTSVFTADAQTLVQKWANTSSSASNNRDLVYNPNTGNLLLAKTTPAIIRLKASDGTPAPEGNMDLTGVNSLSGLAIATDGVIYGCNVTTSVAGTPTIWSWANESSSPTVLWTGTWPTAGGSVGVNLNVYDTGLNTKFILSSSGGNGLYVYHDGSAWVSKTLVSGGTLLSSGAKFIDFDNGGSGKFRILAKTAQNSGTLFSFNPTATSPITLTVDRTYATAPLTFAGSGLHVIDYDPATGLIGGMTRLSSAFNWTNMLIATKGGTSTILAPTELHRVSPPAGTASDGGAVGGVTWGAGALYVSPAATGGGAGIYGYDVTAFLVTAPSDLAKTVGDSSATFTAAFGGSSLTYVWKKGSTVLTDDGKYSGTTTASLTVNNLVVGDTGAYTVTVTGVNSSTATATANLVVNSGPIGPKTWTGGGADNNWTTGANWGGTAINLAGDTAFFDGSTRLSPLMTGSYTVAGVTFNSGAGAFTLGASGGATLTLSGGVTNNSTSDQTLSLPLALSATRNFSADSGTIVASGLISGSGGINKLGTQPLRLTGSVSNTFSGGLTMKGGDVRLAKTSGNAVNGNVTVSSGTLYVENSDQIVDSSVVDLQTSGTTLSLATGVAEKIRGFSVGTLSAAAVSGNVQLAPNAQLTVTPNVTVGYSAVSITAPDPTGTKLIVGASAVNGEVRWTPQDMVNTFEKLVINPGGRLRLGHGGNAWNGQDTMLGAIPSSFMQDQITINGGQIGFNGGSLATPIIINANRGMTITGLATNETLVNAVIPGKITGTGTLVHNGGGDLELRGANDFSGGMNLYAGSVTLSSAQSAGPGRIAFKGNGGTLAVSSEGIVLPNQVDLSAVITNNFGTANNGTNFTLSGNVDLGSTGSRPHINVPNVGASITFSGNLTNTLGVVKMGPGKAILSGNNTYVGATTISNGVLGLGSAASLGANALDLSGASAVLNAEQTLTLNQPGRTIAVNVDGATIAASAGATMTIQDSVSGSVGLNIAGPGAVVLNNAAGYSGAITVATDATFGGAGSGGEVTVNGKVSPGAGVGSFTTANQTWSAGGSYKWEMNNATGSAGSGFDQIAVNGVLSINAHSGSKFTIDITSLAGAVAGNAANFNSSVAQSWTILTTTSGIIGFDASAFDLVTSSFSNPIGGSNFAIETSPSGNDLVLRFTPGTTGGQGAENFQSSTAGSGTFTGSPNTTYTVQYTDSLSPINWQTLKTVATDGSGAGSFTDGGTRPAIRFYRIVLP